MEENTRGAILPLINGNAVDNMKFRGTKALDHLSEQDNHRPYILHSVYYLKRH